MRRLNIHSRANKSAEDLAFESILDDELPLVSSATPLFKKGGQESGPTDKVASRTPGTTRRTTRGTTRGTEKSNMGQHLGQHGTTPGTENELVKTLPGTTPGTHLGQRGTTPGTENAEFNLLKLTVTEERILKFLMAACAFRGGKTSDLIKADFNHQHGMKSKIGEWSTVAALRCPIHTLKLTRTCGARRRSTPPILSPPSP